MHFPRPSSLAFVQGLGWMGVTGLVCASLVACSGGNSGGAPPPTFTEVYTQILGPSCGAVCHNPQGPGVSTGMLDMSTQSAAYQNLVNVMAMGTPGGCAGDGTRVIPNNVDQSILAEKIDPNLFKNLMCGTLMPQGLPQLSQDDITEVESWIAAGAKGPN